MKVKCIRLLNSDKQEVDFSPWLTLEKIYHVMTIFINENKEKSYGIITSHPRGEWPQFISIPEECFEVVSTTIPSNWREWWDGNLYEMSPLAWQAPGFYEAFSDHDPAVYPIFEREREIILHEDP